MEHTDLNVHDDESDADLDFNLARTDKVFAIH